MHDESSYLDVPRVESNATFMMSKHLDDHPLVTEILLDHTNEMSTDPQNEVVIIVGHGPEEVEDNIPDLELMQVHVDRIKAQTEFADVKAINLQDDAYPPIRKSNVTKLRRWISSAAAVWPEGHRDRCGHGQLSGCRSTSARICAGWTMRSRRRASTSTRITCCGSKRLLRSV